MHDVIVVGGGVVGATVAYLCVREALRTLLLDRVDEGRATDAGAGIITGTPAHADGPLLELGRRAAAYYPTLLAQLAEDGGGETGYARCGALRVAFTDDEVTALGAFARAVGAPRGQPGRSEGEDIVEIDPEEAQALSPPRARPRRALHDRTAARIDGRLLNQALLGAAARRGLATARSSVERLVVESGRVSGVVASGETHQAGRVVVAGGAWSRDLVAPIGLALAVAPQRGQIVHLRVADRATGAWPVVLPFRDHYLVSWDGGRIAAGATRETGSGFDPRLTAAGVQEVLAEALRVAPRLAAASILELRVGLRPLSSYGHPVVGPIPAVAGAYVATGHGPSGLTLGPYSARLIADLLVGRAIDLDLAPLGVEHRSPGRPPGAA